MRQAPRVSSADDQKCSRLQRRAITGSHPQSLWPEANAFRPERFAPNQQQHHRYSYLPFGAGGHVCIGQHLALTEAMLILAMILQRFDVHLPPNYTLERTVGAVLQPKSLWLDIQAKT